VDVLTPARRAIAATRVALLATLALGLLLTTAPVDARAGFAPPSQATRDLGTPDAGGVSQTDRFQGFGEVKVYTFAVPPGPATVQVYLGDLWYDVDLSLWRLAGRADAVPGRAGAGCDRPAGCVAATAPSRRRVIQFIEPKTLLETVEGGAYAVVVRPRDAAGFDPDRPFTLRVAVTPPVCAVARGGDDRYAAALAIVPASPAPWDLVTMVVYVLPPFTDLFDFSWSVDGGPAPDGQGAMAQLPGFSLPRTPAGTVTAGVVLRGTRQYTDPTDPTYSHVPLDGGTLTLRCDVRLTGR